MEGNTVPPPSTSDSCTYVGTPELTYENFEIIVGVTNYLIVSPLKILPYSYYKKY